MSCEILTGGWKCLLEQGHQGACVKSPNEPKIGLDIRLRAFIEELKYQPGDTEYYVYELNAILELEGYEPVGRGY